MNSSPVNHIELTRFFVCHSLCRINEAHLGSFVPSNLAKTT